MLLDEYAQTELLATFQVELAEHSQALTRAFLALEKEPETAERHRLLSAALRSAHNLKGASRAVALSAVEMLAHQMEGVLGAASREDVELTPALFDLLFAAVDNLSTAATPGAPMDGAADRLEELRTRLAAAQTGDVQPLTTIESLAPVVYVQAAPVTAPRATARVSLATNTEETIRLPAASLDALLEQLGELVIPRLELHHGLTELAALQVEVEAWQREW